ncbi:16S rRNA (uracil(1498)-N(3))-methyltransferase [Alkalilimnicola sp. S0819]|uniref:16S rRNA (uracil(1498)-N(3))-methyltransferase n=1 Tax=Alkalilimnicola sp. S0819 TaxID=2613922 RepID=UPI0012626B43|nr:16S rRNA (uracil(1498)-N(3))-methyltransferase [Alkalilimnicola sp. S0819]KAB7628136.1 16S rRNA (uracil(1498)-N(3))-methyltransferase [Alkalilimnicola sp. S0819]MPQ15021.1 16S rRNA (uracil(1498)-N(3))-methyltransferase [Alkalilimnicola sp. S0819]
MPRFFSLQPLRGQHSLELDEAAARHVRVLRLPPGAEITLFDGQGGEYAARITQMDKKRVSVDVGAHLGRERESPLDITLIQGVSKGERMDITLQKAVELGASRILPVFSERSVVRLDEKRLEKRRRHWEGVIVSACEQCGRNRIPQLLTPTALKEVWSAPPGGLKLALDPEGDVRLRDLRPEADAPIALLAGPEGGLSEAELLLAADAGFQGLRLGPRVLRTETAGMACLAALQSLFGDA